MFCGFSSFLGKGKAMLTALMTELKREHKLFLMEKYLLPLSSNLYHTAWLPSHELEIPNNLYCSVFPPANVFVSAGSEKTILSSKRIPPPKMK